MKSRKEMSLVPEFTAKAGRRKLQLISTGYFALYLAAIVTGFVQHDLSLTTTGDILVIGLFLFFTSGLIISWFSEFAGGIILQIWHILIWIFSLFVWPDAGMVLVVAFPVLVIGVLLNLSAYKKSGVTGKQEKLRWKFVLRLLLVNYGILYFILMLHDITVAEIPDYGKLPFLLFPVLLLVFITAFSLAWKREFLAGIFLVIWYLIVLFATVQFPTFGNKGPYIMIGFPLFLQGLFYIRLRWYNK
jgi:hypothetical protein